ncbi:MAG: TlpA disulfide reductase family protein [Planctomycetia bacterium]|jgi:thiol-disulfide isomerase/thioredoxin
MQEQSSIKWANFIIPVLLVVAFIVFYFTTRQPAIDLGGMTVEQMPLDPFVIPEGEPGVTKTAADLQGKITFVSFWATWCGPCQMELPHVGALARHFHEDPDVQIWTILLENQADEKTQNAVLQIFDQKNVAMPVYVLTGPLKPETLEPEKIPNAILVDQNGKVVKRWIGGNGNLENEVIELVAALKNNTGKAAAPNP